MYYGNIKNENNRSFCTLFSKDEIINVLCLQFRDTRLSIMILRCYEGNLS